MFQSIGMILMVALFSVPVMAQGEGGVQEVFEANWIGLALLLIILILIIAVVYFGRMANISITPAAYEASINALDRQADYYLQLFKIAAGKSDTPVDDLLFEAIKGLKEAGEGPLRDFLGVPDPDEIGEGADLAGSTGAMSFDLPDGAGTVTLEKVKDVNLYHGADGLTVPTKDEADTKTPINPEG